MDTPNYTDARRMLSDVDEFHDYMGFYPYAEQSPPLEAINAKRGKLITEERRELAEAIASGDKAKILHEGIDVLYVVLGAMVEAGITPDELSVAWSLVHSANMTKQPPQDPLGKASKPENFQPADCSIALGSKGKEHRYAVIAGGKISFVSTIGSMTRDDFTRICMDSYEKTGELPSLITELS